MIGKPSKIITEDRATNQGFDQVISTLNQIADMEVMQGQLLQDVKLSASPTDNQINHKLGRKLIGWHLTRKRDASVIFDKQDANQLKDKFLVLSSSLDTVVDIYVF